MLRRVLLAGALAVLTLPVIALAHDYSAGPLRISHPWSRPAGAGMNGAGYLTIRNTGRTPDALVGVNFAGARRASLHSTRMSGDVMSMQAVTEIVIPPGGSVPLAPGGYHIMFEGLRARSVEGAALPAILVFRRAGRVAVRFTVQSRPPAGSPAAPMGAMSPHSGHP